MTIAEIAKLAGVSSAAVSRYLNNGYISDEKKQKIRGFNQSELLAKAISERIEKPYSANNLKRIRNTQPQSLLNAEQRKQNIKGAFSVENVEEIKGKTVLLIDDIFTTGTTVNECSKVLYESGAKRVLFFSLAVVESV